MENPQTSQDSQTSKATKGGTPAVSTAPIRVSKQVKKRILAELARLNKKELGRPVRTDELIALALSLLRPEHYTQLQDATLSNADRLEKRYREYVKQHGAVSKDEFIGIVLGNTLGMAGAKETVARYVASVPKAE